MARPLGSAAMHTQVSLFLPTGVKEVWENLFWSFWYWTLTIPDVNSTEFYVSVPVGFSATPMEMVARLMEEGADIRK